MVRITKEATIKQRNQKESSVGNTFQVGLKDSLEQLPSAQALTVGQALALIEVVNINAVALTQARNEIRELQARVAELEDEASEFDDLEGEEGGSCPVQLELPLELPTTSDSVTEFLNQQEKLAEDKLKTLGLTVQDLDNLLSADLPDNSVSTLKLFVMH